jgi:hypothetical protein
LAVMRCWLLRQRLWWWLAAPILVLVVVVFSIWCFWSLPRVVGSLDVWFSDYFQICWDLQKSCLWLTSIAPVVTDFPRVVSIFALRSCYWILMGRLILLRDRELVFSNNFMGWVGVFSGTWKYLFWCLFSVFRLYTAPRLCSYFYSGLCPSCAETWLLIYLLLKKNSFRHT